MRCDRCGKDTIQTTMSFFNTDTICMECDDLERAHPLFEVAHRVETEEVMRGNYNFEGIGLPNDLRRSS